MQKRATRSEIKELQAAISRTERRILYNIAFMAVAAFVLVAAFLIPLA
ncbi:hypothetical protein [Cucumibacter marinus]|nr:hypothetical protein [Cucumibacter marinus]